MALDKLDLAVIVGLAIAVALYFGKDFIWPEKTDEGGFLNTDAMGSDRNILQKIKETGKNCIVFYGSQSGTAEDYAYKLSKELSARFGLKTMAADLDQYDFDNFEELSNEILVFFLTATYGEGEPTDDAVDFYEWLNNEADTLSNIRFSVFGLGNSTYEYYNAIGRNINEKLEQKGAERFADYGEGDDGTGTLDEDFLEWKDKVMDTLKNDLNFEEKELVYEPGVEVDEDESLTVDDPEVALGEPDKSYLAMDSDLTKGPFNSHHPYLAPISLTRELFNSKERSCVQVEFDTSASNLRYTTGDHLAVWPSNSDENVETFLKAFGLLNKRDTVIHVKPLDSTISVPFLSPTTYETVLRHYLEISGPVSRQFFLAVAQFAPDVESKKKVQHLGSNKLEFAEEIVKQDYNLADALLMISKGTSWTNVPFAFIIESIPHLQPRYYSISSSSLADKTKIGITAVVEWERKGDRLVSGVATNLIKNIEVEQNGTDDKLVVHYDLRGPRSKFSKFKLPVHVRRSTFKLPSNPSVPVIMIGPGTGVAPFRGFVRDRVQLKQQGQNPGEMLLFYGCRRENEDFLYKNEWPQYSKDLGSKLQLFTAFSRDDPSKKVYVQQRLLENAERINQLIEDGAFVYVCGDASRMAREVQSTMAKIIAQQRNISEEKGAELIRSYKVQNRYQEDVW